MRMVGEFSRRVLLLAGVAAVPASSFARDYPWRPNAPDRPTPTSGADYQFFRSDEAAFIEAAIDRLIPADDTGPGAREAGVKRVVYASSSSVYGETPVLPKREEMTPQPLSPYALSKLVGEHYASVFKHVYGFEVVALRYFNIFGPRQDLESQYAAVIPRFITALLEGKSPVVYGDGLQSRDFTYVDNVVDANLLASEAGGVAGQAFNVACGGRYTLLDLLARLKEILGSDIEPIHEPSRAGDVRDSQASIEAAERALGYRVSVGFEEGLQRTAGWYRAQIGR